MNDELGLSPEQFEELQRQAKDSQTVEQNTEDNTASEKEVTTSSPPQQTQSSEKPNNNVTEDPQAGMNFLEKGWDNFVNGAPEDREAIAQSKQNAMESGFLYSQGGSADTSTDIAESTNKMAQRAGAGGFGLVDAAVGAYNWAMPGDKYDIQRVGLLAPFEDKPAQVMRDISREVLPELLAMGWATKLGGRALSGGVGGLKMGAGIAGMKKATQALNWFQNSAGVKVLGKIGAKGSGAAAAAQVTFDPYDEVKDDPEAGINVAGFLKHKLGWKFIPDGIATATDNTPEEKRAKNMYQAAIMGGMEPMVGAAFRMFLNRGGVARATQYVAETENAVKKTAKMNENAKAITGNAGVDKLIRESESLNKDLDDYGAYMLSKIQKLDEPVKGIHSNFDAIETGLRTRDADGVLGAMNDTYRIANNVDSYNGRVGSMFTSAAAKHGLELDQVKKGWLVGEIIKEIGETNGITTKLPSGKTITSTQRATATTDLYLAMTDPRADAASIIELAEQMAKQVPKYGKGIAQEAGAAAMRKYTDTYLNLQKMQANALAQTSMAGQVADMADTGAKMFDKMQPDQLMDEMMDRLKALMLLKEIDNMDSAVALGDKNLLQRWMMRGDEAALKNLEIRARRRGLTREQKIEEQYRKVQDYIDVIEELRVNKPQWMKPLMMMFEATNGRVSTMYQMNNVIRQSLGSLRKAIYDGQTEFPQLIMKEMQGSLYNSTLSAVETAWNMGIGTYQGIVDHAISPFVGALTSGDVRMVQEHASALAAQAVHTRSSLMAGIERFKQLSKDPDKWQAALKPDYALKQSELLESLEAASDAALVDGNNGIYMALQQRAQIHAMNTDPLMRLVPNLGGGFDASAQSGLAYYHAHRRAYLQLQRGGRDMSKLSDFGKGRLKVLERRIYDDMFDENGLLREPLSLNEAQDVTLTKDNFLGDALDGLTKQIPPIKQAMMFPRMMGAAAEMQYNYTAIPLMRSMGGFTKPINDMPFAEMKQILADKGIKVSDYEVLDTFRFMRTKARGRAVLGSALLGVGISGALEGRLRGRGLYDPAKQKARGKNWKQSTYMGLDGKWHSHKWMGPFSKLLDLIADTQDNFDILGEQPMENLNAKVAFIVGGLFDNVDMMSGVQPFLDALAGKPGALDRFSAQYVNRAMPMSGFRQDWSDFLDPQLDEVYRDFGGYLRAQNGWLDVLSPETALPDAVSITGKPINADLDTFTRMKNAFSPFKTNAELEPEEIFLFRTEYPMDVSFKTIDGMKLDNVQQQELKQLVFKDPEWQRGLKRIVNQYKYYDFEGKMEEARAQGDTSVDTPISKFFGLHADLDKLLHKVRDRVAPQLSDWQYLKVQKTYQAINESRAKQGLPAAKRADEFVKEMNP